MMSDEFKRDSSTALPSITHHSSFITAFSFALSAGCTTLCYLAAGATLGLVFGGIAFITLLLPLMRDGRTAVAVVAGAAAAWLLGRFSLAQWLACDAVALAYAAALLGAVMLLQRLRLNEPLAVASIMLIAFAWLTWPFWLGAWRGQNVVRAVGWLVRVHPLFAINSALRNLGMWTEQPIAYRLMNLNQDVPFELPASIWPCVLLHGAIAAVLMTAAKIKRSSAGAPSDQ